MTLRRVIETNMLVRDDGPLVGDIVQLNRPGSVADGLDQMVRVKGDAPVPS